MTEHDPHAKRPVAKVVIRTNKYKDGKVMYVEVIKQQRVVAFDPRPNWVLVSFPLDKQPAHREVMWIHPDEAHFCWVRDFTLA